MFISFSVAYFFIFLIGLCVGSFLNCVIYRLALPNFSFWKNLGGLNRSYCPHCKYNLAWLDLIPVFSFLFLKGKCRYCKKKISLQYPIVEILTGLVFLLIFFIMQDIEQPDNFINFLFLFLISKGKWIGFGDVKLAILLGFLLGFPNILSGLFLSFFFGAIIGLILMFLNKKGLESEIPFAPFLIIGTFVAMFFGDQII